MLLDSVAVVLRIPPDEAHVLITAVQAAFKQEGKPYSFEKVARISNDALRQRHLEDPDVRYAAQWLAANKSHRT